MGKAVRRRHGTCQRKRGRFRIKAPAQQHKVDVRGRKRRDRWEPPPYSVPLGARHLPSGNKARFTSSILRSKISAGIRANPSSSLLSRTSL